ncbi:uncharacterized protein [Notamacropus eugenii]|uniref:uncharacterized protein isoform X2 n=1 Tax=Notamacropus eugenii TaxID=9315 RepID=UPI003B673E86
MLGSMVPPPLPPPPPPASPVQVLILPTSNQKDLGGGWEIKRWGYLKGETRCVPPPTEGAPSFLSGCGGLLAIPRNPISCEAPRKARGRDSCISRSGPLGSLPAPRILLLLPPQPEPEPSRSRAGARDCTPFPSAASQHRHPFPPVAFRGSIQAPGRRAEQRPSLVLGGKHHWIWVQHVTTFRLTVKASLDNPACPHHLIVRLDDAKHPEQLPEDHFTA